MDSQSDTQNWEHIIAMEPHLLFFDAGGRPRNTDLPSLVYIAQ